jgi:hypothetical protein
MFACFFSFLFLIGLRLHLGIPLIHDQEENAVKVVASGSGLQLSKYSTSLVQEVEFSVSQLVTDDSFTVNAKRISKYLTHGGMCNDFALLCFALIRLLLGPLRGTKAVVFWVEYTLNVGAEHLVTPLVVSGGLSAISLYNLDIVFLFLCSVLVVKYTLTFMFNAVVRVSSSRRSF